MSVPTVSRELRLRRIGPEQAAALSHLFAGHDVAKSKDVRDVIWTFSPARTRPGSALLLRGAHHELALRIAHDGLCESLGPRQWWDYQGESRLLAWTLAHATLLEALSALLQDSLMPVGWTPTVTESELADTLALGFSARTAEDRTTAGVLGASCATVERLAAAAEPPPSPAVHSWAKRLQAQIHVVLRTTSFPRGELLAARIGDLLALGRRTRCWRNVLLIHAEGEDDFTPCSDWSARYDGERELEICDARLEDLAEVVMSESMTDEVETNAAGKHALESLPVVLDFDVGTLRMPLAELALLKPGYVFQLPGCLENAQVVIRANGKRIGRGELVAVGDVLGVQLLAIDADGLR